MLNPLQFKILCSIAVLGLLVIGIDIALYFSNQPMQNEANGRAQYIQQTNSVANLYQESAQKLASLALEHHDEEVKSMLTKEGFKFNAAN